MDKQRTRKTAPRIVGQAAAFVTQTLNQERLRLVIRGLHRFLLCAVLSRGSILGGYAPFGLAIASALLAQGAGLSAIGGVFFGAMLLGGSPKSGVYAAASLLVLCVMGVCAGLRVARKHWFAPLVAMLAGGVCTFVFLPVDDMLTASAILTFVGVQILTFTSCCVYSIALAPPLEDDDWRRPVTMLALTATVLLSLADLQLFDIVTPARILSQVLTLSAAYLGGSTTGAAVGVVFGVAMDLTVGRGALFTCVYGLCGLVAGLFREQGRGWFALCSLCAGVCAALLAADDMLFMSLLLETVVSVILFIALPSFVWTALRQTLLPESLTSEAAHTRVRRSVGTCATETAQAFYDLYLAMLAGAADGKAIGDSHVSTVFDRASDRVCKHCALCSQCWQRDYITTLAAMNDITQPMLQRGRAVLSDFPQHFAARCIHLPELMQAMNQALFALRERESLRRQQQEQQSLLARQYAGITDILRQIGTEVTRDYTSQPLMERQVKRYAAAFGWIDRVSVLRDVGGRLLIELYGDGITDILRQSEGFAAGLSALLRIGLTPPTKVEDEIGTRLVLRERAPFRAVVGMGRQQKEGVSVSGDSSNYFLTDEGVACLLLADGMGSGAVAARDSHTLLNSVERFLRAGIAPADALKAVAPAFRLRSDGTRFTTLDVLTIDLFTGRAESVKCGAAPSYLRTGGQWTILRSGTLPVGLVDADALPEPLPLRFGHGDLFVMLSDGVSDGTNDTWIRDELVSHAGDSPKELAARLVDKARSYTQDDDRTVLVLRIEKVH